MAIRRNGSVLLGYLGLLALAGIGLFLLSLASGAASQAIANRVALKVDLAHDYDEIAANPPLPEVQNAWVVYRDVPTLAVLDSPAQFLSALDGRQARGEAADIDALLVSMKPELDAFREASKKPHCEVFPDFSQFRLSEFDNLQKAGLAFAVQAVRTGNLQGLVPAANIGRHLSENPFVEAALASAWVRLYILKAMDRLDAYDPKIMKQLGPWPDLRRSLRGELVHDLNFSRFKNRGMGFDMTNGPVNGRLKNHWQRRFRRIPAGDNYAESVAFFEDFEEARRGSRFPRGYNREGFTQLARLLLEAKELDQRLAKS